MKRLLSLFLILLTGYTVPTYCVKNPFKRFFGKKSKKYTRIEKTQEEKQAEMEALLDMMDDMGFCVLFSEKQKPKKTTKK